MDSVLRDKLAADDRMELALDVAARCNVEAAPVWSAWGLVKLRMRQFLPARDKLKNFFGAWLGPCTVEAVGRAYLRRSGRLSRAMSVAMCWQPTATTSDLASRNKVLVSIVTTLEQSRNNDLSRLKELQGKLIEFYQSSGRRPGTCLPCAGGCPHAQVLCEADRSLWGLFARHALGAGDLADGADERDM